MGSKAGTAHKRKPKRRTKAQIETDRRLSALRKNLAAEIEADIDRFAGEAPSPVAGFLVMTRVRVLLAFLQAFFPMFISPPKPRRIRRKTSGRKKKKTTPKARTKPAGAKNKLGKRRTKIGAFAGGAVLADGAAQGDGAAAAGGGVPVRVVRIPQS